MNNETKHTPGPWELGHELGYGFSVAHDVAPNCGRLLVVAVCAEQAPMLGNEITREIAKANARLIAAAPQLLEACKAANLRLLQQKSTVEDADILDLLQAAITKAERAQ